MAQREGPRWKGSESEKKEEKKSDAADTVVAVDKFLIVTDLYLVNDVDYTIDCRQIGSDDGGISNADALGTKWKKFV